MVENIQSQYSHVFILFISHAQQMREDESNFRVIEEDRGKGFRKCHKTIESILADDCFTIIKQFVKIAEAISEALLNERSIWKVYKAAKEKSTSLSVTNFLTIHDIFHSLCYLLNNLIVTACYEGTESLHCCFSQFRKAQI